jgi:riboflavin kinase/FMN adenylyltransferase
LSHKILTDADLFANIPGRESFKKPVVTIGSFDGVHIGHKKIIDAVLEQSAQQGGDSVVVTFEMHPRLFLNPEYALSLITTNQEKIDILKNMGIKHVLMLRFSREMANLHALDFYNKLLIEKLGVKEIIIGYDHAFGRDREGGIELLQKLGAENNIGIMRINEELSGTRAVSSTWIRDELAAGNVAFANKLLARPYSITGYVVRGESRGGTLLGYPTANVQPNNEKKVVPSDGAYAVTVLLEGLPEKYGMLNIGDNPTFQGKRKTSEVNIFDFYADLYGQEITVRFHERIRGEKKFSGIDELRKQLALDKKAAVEIFEKQ